MRKQGGARRAICGAVLVFVTACAVQSKGLQMALPSGPSSSEIVLVSGTGVEGSGLQRHLAYLREKREQLARSELSERDRRVEQAALSRYMAWALRQEDRTLVRSDPSVVFALLLAKEELEERREEARQAAVEKKLEEYWDWAFRLQREASGDRFTMAGSAYLVTESPLRVEAIDALIRAVLDWGYASTTSPVFLKRSPSEVALYLLAKSEALASVVELGVKAPPHLDYLPQFDRSLYTAEEAVLELLVGVTPFIGNIAEAVQAIDGTSLTGHELETSDRVIGMLAVLVPLLKTAKKAPQLLGALVRTTGRSANEIEAVFKVARHLTPEEANEVDRLVRAVAEGRKLQPAQIQTLNRVVLRLEGPVRELVKVLRQGRKVTVDAITGAKLIPGTSEHMVQRWLDYQFLHLDHYRSLNRVPDARWKEQYWRAIQNNRSGSLMQRQVLKAKGLEKNTAVLVPPPGQAGVSFIPDAVRGHKGELAWGQPYRFVEIKGRQEVYWSGNLQAMIQYVDTHGGFMEVILRSKKHPRGATVLSQRIAEQLQVLERQGKAKIEYHPR